MFLESDLPIDALRESNASWVDYDKDGDLDLFLTGLDTDGVPKSLLYKAERFAILSEIYNSSVIYLSRNHY